MIIKPNAIAGLSNGPDLMTSYSFEGSGRLGKTSPPSVSDETPSGVTTSLFNNLLATSEAVLTAKLINYYRCAASASATSSAAYPLA